MIQKPITDYDKFWNAVHFIAQHSAGKSNLIFILGQPLRSKLESEGNPFIVFLRFYDLD